MTQNIHRTNWRTTYHKPMHAAPPRRLSITDEDVRRARIKAEREARERRLFYLAGAAIVVGCVLLLIALVGTAEGQTVLAWMDR